MNKLIYSKKRQRIYLLDVNGKILHEIDCKSYSQYVFIVANLEKVFVNENKN